MVYGTFESFESVADFNFGKIKEILEAKNENLADKIQIKQKFEWARPNGFWTLEITFPSGNVGQCILMGYTTDDACRCIYSMKIDGVVKCFDDVLGPFYSSWQEFRERCLDERLFLSLPPLPKPKPEENNFLYNLLTD